MEGGKHDQITKFSKLTKFTKLGTEVGVKLFSGVGADWVKGRGGYPPGPYHSPLPTSVHICLCRAEQVIMVARGR